MQEFSAKGIDTLSDGERQRVMIARALAQDTPIILLDEPTAFLDLPNKYEIGLLLRRLAHDEGKCIVFSTHDPAICTGTVRHNNPARRRTVPLRHDRHARRKRRHGQAVPGHRPDIRPGYPQRQAPRRIASASPPACPPAGSFPVCGEIATFAGYRNKQHG